MALPALRDFSSPTQQRASTAPAGSPGSGRRGQSNSCAPSPPSGHKRIGQRPVTAASQLSTATPQYPGSPPSTAKSSSLNRTWPSKAQSEVMRMVHRYWAPVEEAVRTRHPGKLEKALKDMHGSEYLRTIYSVRRSTGLKASERHAIEMELAARLVRARAVLGKWQAGLREIRDARQSRDAERLQKMLDKWTFAEEDGEIADARGDLERWYDFAVTLPAVLKDATEKLDVDQLRKAVGALNTQGPNGVEGSCGARKILGRYDLQARALADAVLAGSSRLIKEALGAWSFDSQDPHIEAAHTALQKCEDQRALIRQALESKDCTLIQKAVDDWEFERDSADYLEARSALGRYVSSCGHLSSIAQTPGNLLQLADALNTWEFAEDDPVLHSARGVLAGFEENIRNALSSRDGWQLERHWCSGKVAKTLFGGQGNLYEQGMNFLHQYEDAVAILQQTLRRAEDLDVKYAPTIRRLVEEWKFASNDPALQAAQSWLQFHKVVQLRTAATLQSATQAGDVFALQRLLPYARRTMMPSCTELHTAHDVCKVHEEAVGFIGAVALGVEPQQLKGALDRSSRLEKSIQNIRSAVGDIEVKWITGLKSVTKPPAIVHAVFQMIIHVLARISPHIRDPPRSCDWRSCQKMISSAPAFSSNLMDVPNAIASGNVPGVGRARAQALDFQVQYADEWSEQGIASYNACAAVLFRYLVHIFAYADLIEAPESGASPAGSRPESRSASTDPARGWSSERPSEQFDSLPPRSSMLQRATSQPPSARPSVLCGSNRPSVVVKSRTSHLVRSRSLSEITAAFQQPLAMVEPMAPLMFLQTARRSLCRSKVLAIAWVLSGRDPKEIQNCIDRMRKHAHCAEAAAVVAAQMVAHFLPLGRMLSSSDSSGNMLSDSIEDPLTLTSRISDEKSQVEEETAAPAPNENGSKHSISLTVKLISGVVVANLCMQSTSTVSELKQRLESIEGTPVSLQRLLHEGHTLLDSADLHVLASVSTVTLIRMAPNLPQLVDSAAHSVSSSGLDTSYRIAPQGQCSMDSVSYLIFGPQGDKLSSRPRRGNLQPEVLKVLRATKGAMNHMPLDSPGDFSDLQLRADPLSLDREFVAHSQVPLMNLALAKRAISAEGAHPAMDEFLVAMNVFFKDFVPLRAALTHAVRQAEEAQIALAQCEEVAAFATSLECIGEPRVVDIEGVRTAASLAMDKVQHLAQHGVALPAMYVECIRKAIDDAGARLLASPPAADPSARLQWSEAAMAIQLAPVPHISTALKGIAKSMLLQDVEGLADSAAPAPSTECVRLLGAVIWVTQTGCRCNPSWQEVKLALTDSAKFLESLQSWSPVRDASAARVTRARDLLLGIWSWAAAGCDGNRTLGSVFAWVSLVVASLPLAEMAQQLTPVYKGLKQGLAKSQRAPAHQQKLAKSKAWNTALFLLDGQAERWWWLRLIRPVANMDMPWRDSDDGGVSQSHAHHDSESPKGISADAGAKSTENLEKYVAGPEPGMAMLIGAADVGFHDIGLDEASDESGDEYLHLEKPDIRDEAHGEELLQKAYSAALLSEAADVRPQETAVDGDMDERQVSEESDH